MAVVFPIVVSFLNQISEVVRDVEANCVDLLSFLKLLERVVVVHNLGFRDAPELLPFVDHGRDLIGESLAVGTELFVPRLRVAVKTGGWAGAGDGRSGGCRGSHFSLLGRA